MGVHLRLPAARPVARWVHWGQVHPHAILVHPLALLSAPPIGIEDSKVKDTVKF